MSGQGDEARATAPVEPELGPSELEVFRAQECYVYKIPPATTLGHRAELWGINNWLKAVSCKCVTVGDDLFVRLFDQETAELFAECPVRADTPIHACIEPVVDSSRYFSIRVEDAARGAKQHAFIGLGFRERDEASAFKAALDDQQQYIRRKREAVKIDEELEAAEHDGPTMDFRLKEGEKISMHLNTAKALHRDGNTPHLALCGGPIKTIATAAGLVLAPPPGVPAPGKLPEATGKLPEAAGKLPEAAAAGPPALGRLSGAAPQEPSAGGVQADEGGDDWGDFVG